MSNWNDRANATPSEAPRDWKQAIGRGFRCRCPACGEGKLFGKFLKVKPECGKCGAEFLGHRADDLPPYITIMIVGHVIVPLFLVFERSTNWPEAAQSVSAMPQTNDPLAGVLSALNRPSAVAAST